MIVLHKSWITFGRNCDTTVHTLSGSVVELKPDEYHASHSIKFLCMMNVLSIVENVKDIYYATCSSTTTIFIKVNWLMF